ncbi:hypothetical protein [Synechococcus sp. LTW-R]|uniref:hypothetical protein n=1 Tax=Synechococcus sp. LTW-R TaxID=2751170 RepID=UPI00162607FA|nr:hypothetical protein [Synechococcus sp. LTW-R]QNG28491.1 hypothetical protein H0O22_07570 [Synechococcus sp. LTW-R]
MATTPSSFLYHPRFFSFNPDLTGRSGARTANQVHGFPEQEPFWISHAHDYIRKIALEYLNVSSRAQGFNCRCRLKEVAETHHHLPRRRRPTTPPGIAPAEKKPASQCVGILSCSDCGEVGATGEKQMKTLAIRLPDVEAAMLVEVQKVNRAYRDRQGLLISQIQQEYAKTPKGRASR